MISVSSLGTERVSKRAQCLDPRESLTPISPWAWDKPKKGSSAAAGSWLHPLHRGLCLLDANPDRAPEGLRQRLRLAHLQGEDLAARDGCEWGVRAQGLCHAWGRGGLGRWGSLAPGPPNPPCVNPTLLPPQEGAETRWAQCWGMQRKPRTAQGGLEPQAAPGANLMALSSCQAPLPTSRIC